VHPKTERATNALAEFYADPIDDILSRHARERPEDYLLDFFRGVVRDVPAYRKFLEREGVDPERVVTLADFAALPPTTKLNYQRAFSLAELCRGGKLENADFLAVSTGSTGEPTAWPRFVSDEVGTTERFEQVLHDGPRAHERRTLAVICFALGSWVGGMYTTFACRHLAAKGYPVTLVTPGSNKAEILRVVRELGPEFEQTILFGYPPFLKDVIDAGRAADLDWGRLSVSLVTAGEVFSEEWRSLICERLGGRVPALHTASLYGTADGGVLANETPLSIEVRRALSRHPAAARELFGEARLPTLCQYDPTHRFFEPAGDELLFSGDSGAPLVRYKILDRGGVIPYADLMEFLIRHGEDPAAATRALGAEVRPLPFVYVFGRSNFALSFYGANVYPENVSVGLEQPDVAEHVTGKFVMQIARSVDQDPRLEIFVELSAGIQANEALEARITHSLQAALERLNSEFFNYAPVERRTPLVHLLPLAHPEYFPPGVKHRYSRA
jgi:phenylacetate-CoA ligase